MARPHLPANVQRRLKAQQELLDRFAAYTLPPDEVPGPFITLSRQYGCRAFDLAERLADRLNLTVPGWRYTVIDPKAIGDPEIGLRLGETIVNGLSERTRGLVEDWIGQLLARRPAEARVFGHLARTLCTIAARGQVIIIGRGGAAITRKVPNGVHLRIVAPLAWRVENLSRLPERPEEASTTFVRQADRERESFVRKYLGLDVNDPDLYDLILNASRLSVDEQVAVIAGLISSRSRAPHPA